MAELSGIVAILDPTLASVLEIRNLGPTPRSVKGDRVRPFVEVKPALTGDEYYATYADAVGATTVTRTWTKVAPNYPALDQTRLNNALAEQGSVVRALAEIMFEEINRLRVVAGLAVYTTPQFVAALQSKMRS